RRRHGSLPPTKPSCGRSPPVMDHSTPIARGRGLAQKAAPGAPWRFDVLTVSRLPRFGDERKRRIGMPCERYPSLALTAFVMCLGLSSATASAQTTADGWVVLPVDEYRALRDRANPPPTPPAPPPVEATLTRVDYDLRVDASG